MADQRLIEMRELWEQVRPIKNRCHNATEEEMEKLTKLVTSYNTFVGRAKLKISACQIPNILSKVSNLLHGHGIIDKIEAL